MSEDKLLAMNGSSKHKSIRRLRSWESDWGGWRAHTNTQRGEQHHDIGDTHFPRLSVFPGAVRVLLLLERPPAGLLLDPVTSVPVLSAASVSSVPPVISTSSVSASSVPVAPSPAPAPPSLSVSVPAPGSSVRSLPLNFIFQIAEATPLWVRTLNIN